MQKKTRQEQQLERLIRLRSDSELAIFDEVQVARDEVEEAKQEVEKLREYVDNHLIGPQGEQGIKGDKGDRGEKGDKGDKGKDGRDGRDGRDGMDGIDGQDGENGKDGKDGSPDTAEQIVSKLQTVKSQWLDAKAIKNLPQPVINNYQSFIGRGGGASVGLETIKSSGTIVKQGASTLEFDSTFSVTPTVNGAIISAIGDGTGDVHGPTSSTDEAIARFDGTTGKIIQDYTSGAPTISDTGAVTIPLTTGNSLVVDTDTLVVDATNNRVGIGTASPTSTLQVQGSSASDVRAMIQNVNGSANTSSSLYLITRNTVGDTSVGSRIQSVRTDVVAGSNDLAFSTSSGTTMSERMRLTSTTLLGIGTNAPTHTLTLPSTSTGIALYNTADQTTNIEVAEMSWGSNIFTVGTRAGGSGSTRILSLQSNTSSSTARLRITRSTFPLFLFETSGSTVTANGNVISVTLPVGSSSGIQSLFTIQPTISQSGTAGYNGLLINPTESSTGSGVKALIRGQVGGTDKFLFDNAGFLGLQTTAPTHSLTLSSTSTGIALYNTADQTTNYERLLTNVSGNVFQIGSYAGGSGAVRSIRFGVEATVGSGTLGRTFIIGGTGSGGRFNFNDSTSQTGISIVGLTGTHSASSSTQQGLSIAYSINQSGTAGYTALLINPTESATGSGTKRLISAQVGSVDKFVVDNAGNTTATTFNPATKQTYNITNVTTDRAYDANATTLDEVADTLGTLIADLRAIGLVS